MRTPFLVRLFFSSCVFLVLSLSMTQTFAFSSACSSLSSACWGGPSSASHSSRSSSSSSFSNASNHSTSTSYTSASASTSACGIYSTSSSSSSSDSSAANVQCAIADANAWSAGYDFAVNVTNTGTEAVSAWEVYIALGEGHTIGNTWGADVSLDGQIITAENLQWNGALQPGQNTTFGINGTHPGAFIQPQCITDSLPNRAPGADVEVDVYSPTVFVDAQASTDPDDNPLTYEIDFGDGEVIHYSNAWHTYRAAGDYTVTVTVSDGELTDIHTEAITVTEYTGGNRAPIAMLAIGSDRGRIYGRANAAFDEDGDALTYTWDVGTGPTTSTSPSSPGRYVNGGAYVTVTVSDGELADTRQMFAPANCAYWYDFRASANFEYHLDDMTVYVDARDSEAAYNINWTFGDGTTSNDLVTSHTYAEPGIYRLTLSASGIPFSDTEAVTLVVGDVQDNEPPVPALVCEESTMDYIDGPVTTCDVSGTLDPDGDYLTYIVDWGDGSSSGVASYTRFAHQYEEPGDYVITLTVSDTLNTVTEQFNWTSSGQIDEPNEPPVAAIACTEVERAVEQPDGSSVEQYFTACSGVGTVDPNEDDDLVFSWEMGDGATYETTRSIDTVFHQYQVAGSYTVTMTVSDGEFTDTITREVASSGIELPDNNTPPTACFRIIQNAIYPPPLNATFDAICSSDADGDTLTYQWDFGDGSTATGVITSHQFANPGRYETRLTVSDGRASHFTIHTGTYGAVGTAQCEYVLTSEWGTGFTGAVRITNEGVAPLNGWLVEWQYAGGERIGGAWNTQLSGNNPYTATSLGWNAVIQTGQTVEFGFQGTKPEGNAAEIPTVTGAICE